MTNVGDDFRATLFDARKASGLTQQQVAKTIGVTRSSVANYEQGRQSFPIATVQAYANVVGYTLTLVPQGGER